MKTCARCHREKSLAEFYVGRNADGRHSYCKPCVAEYQAACLTRRRADPAAAEHDRSLSRRRARSSARRLRLDVVRAYGGACVCCGETEEAFLSIDHKFDDGAAERRAMGKGRDNPDPLGFYRSLRARGWPKDRYQLLCHNCNFAKARRGACPHGNAPADGDLTITELARATNRSPEVLRRWLRSGRLPGIHAPSGEWLVRREAALLLGEMPRQSSRRRPALSEEAAAHRV